MFPPSGEGWEMSTLLGLVGRNIPNHSVSTALVFLDVIVVWFDVFISASFSVPASGLRMHLRNFY
jgi:hypothetical protein